MTDLEEWKAFLAKFGVDAHEGPADPYDTSRMKGEPATTSLTTYAGDNDRVVGYGGFYTAVEFDADGKFLRVGIWE